MIQPKQEIKKLLLNTGLYRFAQLKNQFHVLPYHSVVDNPNPFFPQVSLSLFEKHMAHLAKNYRVIDFETLMERIRSKESIRKCVVITFDDGFLDNLEVVAPVLKKYNFPATIFLTTDFIDNKTTPWFLKFRFAFQTTKEKILEIDMGDTHFSFSLKTQGHRLDASNKVMGHLRKLSEQDRVNLVNQLYEKLGVADFGSLENLMLNWDQVRELSNQGVSFGAHTVSHPVLSRISPSQAEQEIRDSKLIIESNIQKPVTAFAYPFGKCSDYTETLLPVLEKLGFQCAVTTETHANNPGVHPFFINRNIPWEMANFGS